jgi:diadenylate cyclase
MDNLIIFIRQWIIPPIEIFIISVVIYSIYKILVRTRAIQILKGIFVLIAVFIIASILKMEIILYILQSGIQLFAIAVIVVFSQEIRRIFSKLGTNTFFSRLFSEKHPEIIDIITETVEDLSETKTGALIIFEKKVGLRNYIENTGVKIDSNINKELLLSIFFKNTPLHDGAVICRDNRVIAASVVVPASTKENIDTLFGLRHRAGIGITEESDAVAIIVSEETGKISIAEEGKIHYNLDIDKFKKMLSELILGEKEEEGDNFFKNFIIKFTNFVDEKKKKINDWIDKHSKSYNIDNTKEKKSIPENINIKKEESEKDEESEENNINQSEYTTDEDYSNDDYNLKNEEMIDNNTITKSNNT